LCYNYCYGRTGTSSTWTSGTSSTFEHPHLLHVLCLAFPCSPHACSFPRAYGIRSQFDRACLWGELSHPLPSGAVATSHARACTRVVRMLLLARDAAVDRPHPGEKESSRAWCSFVLHACCHAHGYTFVLHACYHACLASYAYVGTAAPEGTISICAHWPCLLMKHLQHKAFAATYVRNR
jgi:hypothetical protein